MAIVLPSGDQAGAPLRPLKLVNCSAFAACFCWPVTGCGPRWAPTPWQACGPAYTPWSSPGWGAADAELERRRAEGRARRVQRALSSRMIFVWLHTTARSVNDQHAAAASFLEQLIHSRGHLLEALAAMVETLGTIGQALQVPTVSGDHNAVDPERCFERDLQLIQGG